MSGYRNKNASDVTKNRNAYMESLNLQEQLNDMNLQANKTYLLSGQLPPASQMQDTRTSSEKLKDVESMKQQIAKDLYDIAEPQFAYAIVNKVLNSPLNVNNSLFRFFAQRAKQINEQLKPLYPYRIEGDINDIEQIVNFIKNMYNNTQGSFQSVKTYINSYSVGSDQSKIMSANDIDPIITSLTEIIKNFEISKVSINERIPGGGTYRFGHLTKTRLIARIQYTQQKLLEFRDSLPTTEQLHYFLNQLENNISMEDPTGFVNTRGSLSENLKQMFHYLESHLPKYQDVSTLINKGKQYAIYGKYDLLEKTIESIVELFGFLFNDDEFNRLLTSVQPIKNIGLHIENQQYSLRETQRLRDIESQNQEERQRSNATKVYVMNDPLNVAPVDNHPQIEGLDTGPDEDIENFKFDPTDLFKHKEMADKLNKKQQPNFTFDPTDLFENRKRLEEYGDDDIGEFPDEYKQPEDVPIRTSENNPIKEHLQNAVDQILENRRNNQNGTKQKKLYNDTMRLINTQIKHGNWNQNDIDFFDSLKYNLENEDDIENDEDLFNGSGISKPKKRRSQFVGFGISEINNRSLENNIVKIRRAGSKSNYMDLPSKRVTPHMKNIITRISGGGMPEFEDLSKLDNDEKKYLNKLLEKADLKGRLSIPAPSKDQEEKEIHEFEVMKGQLMSGNDSKEFVKKFKLVMRKLAHKQLLPRNEVRDMIEILEDNGY
jgi:predicted DNA-binding protein YlxM (UPF0122 family)